VINLHVADANRMKRFKRGMQAAVIAPIAALMLSFPASAQSHPNESVYRYRVKDHVLQAPWYSYPEGRERGQWNCFDDTSKMAVPCSFVIGSLEEFRYVFQRDLRKLRFIDVPAGALY
jgi:hypothetical protein